MHIFKGQLRHPDASQQRLVIRTVLLQIANQVRGLIHQPRRDETPDLVDLFPTLSPGVFQRRLDVLECQVDFFGEVVGGAFPSRAVPSAYVEFC